MMWLCLAALLWKHVSDVRHRAADRARLVWLEQRMEAALRDLDALVGLLDVDHRQGSR